MKNLKKILSLVLALAMALSLMTVAFAKDTGDFADGDDVTYAEAVDVMATVGVFNGVGDGSNFDPKGTLTREQAAKIITYMIMGQAQADKLVATIAPFADVSADRWSAGAIAYCASEGIMNGTGNGKFNPTGELTGLQFAKMLLVALGYDAEIEDMTGAAWGLATSKLAYDINLDDGLASDVSLTNVLTREQAAQMAFTTMKTPMVQYADKGTTIEVNGATVSFGAKQASYRTSTVDKGQTISRDRLTNSGDFLVEFAERHCTNLKLTKGTDDFARPANIWYWKAEKIGTYEDEADATYTATVKSKDIYKDLNLGDTVAAKDVTIYVDGVEDDTNAPAVAIKKGSDTKIGETGNGVLTQVYYDDSNNTMVITQVKTYIGQINRTVAATDSKDAYVEVVTSVGTAGVAPVGASGTEKFETAASFGDEDYVLYTFSRSADEIKSVKASESTTGNVSQVVNKSNDRDNSKLTMDGTEYKASKTMARDLLAAMSVDRDYTAYLDEYGYVIYVSEEDYKDYAMVLDIEGTTAGTTGFGVNRVKLVLADGTVKVVTTDKNYTAGSTVIADNEIVTYKVRDNGEYTLKKLVADKCGSATANGAGTNNAFNLKSEKASIATGATGAEVVGGKPAKAATVYGNSKSTFVIFNKGDDAWSSYTGIKSAPSVTSWDISGNDRDTAGNSANEYVKAYWYCKSGAVVTVMFIVPDDERLIEDENNKLLFLAKGSVSDLYHNSTGDYYEYNAMVGDEIKTVKVDAALGNALNGLYSRYTVDKDGIITVVTAYSTAAPTNTNKVSGCTVGSDRNTADYTVLAGVNNSGANLGSGSDSVVTAANRGIWTVADNCKFFTVDEDGKIETGSYASVTKDADDRLYYILDNSALTYVFVETVNTKNDASAATVTITADKNAPVVGDNVTLTANVTLADPKNDTITKYEWYKSTTNHANLAALKADAAKTKLSSTTNTCTEFDTTAVNDPATVYYYCVVTTTNDTMDGKSTAEAMAKFSKDVKAVPGVQKAVRVSFQTDTSDDGTRVKAVTVNVEVDGAGYGELKAADLTAVLPVGYKITDTGSGLPKDIEPNTGIVKVKVEEKTVKSVALVNTPTGDFLLKYGANAAAIKTAAKDAGIQVKVTYDDDTFRTLDADADGMTWSGTTTGDGNAKVTYATRDSGNLAFKVYAEIEKSAITAPTGWTVDSITTTGGKIGTKDIVTLTDTVTVTMHKTTAAKYDDTAKAAEFTAPNVSAITGATAGDTVTVAIDDATTDTNAVIKVTFGVKTAFTADALTAITIAAA